MSKFLVTGASGFIGQHVMNQYPDSRAVIRCDSKKKYKDVHFVSSLDSKTSWDNAFDNIDCIIHLAGLAHSTEYSEFDYNEVNVQGTYHLALEAARNGVKRFVFVSSIGVNGSNSHTSPFRNLDLPNPHNSYAKSKLDAELALRKVSEDTGLEVVIVRPTLVYGPNAPGNFGALTRFINRLSILPFGLANNKRSFIAVQNLANLLGSCAMHPDAPGHVFLGSDGEAVSTKYFTTSIGKGIGKVVYQLPIPIILMQILGKLFGKSTIIEQLYGNLEVDSSNLKEVLGWTAPLTMKQAMSSLGNLSER